MSNYSNILNFQRSNLSKFVKMQNSLFSEDHLKKEEGHQDEKELHQQVVKLETEGEALTGNDKVKDPVIESHEHTKPVDGSNSDKIESQEGQKVSDGNLQSQPQANRNHNNRGGRGPGYHNRYHGH